MFSPSCFFRFSGPGLRVGLLGLFSLLASAFSLPAQITASPDARRPLSLPPYRKVLEKPDSLPVFVRDPDALKDYYRFPLDKADPTLSGSYGELRSNHFHSGLDISTGGASGVKLYAVADGYVSRIGVSPSGYGNALYINHPNGTTSVYGHLLEFAPRIRRYVEEKQYETRSFAQTLYLDSLVFRVGKGDYIGKTGNSGASGGPHLHFEIRDTRTQVPLNLLRYGIYPFTDNLPPIFRRIHFYSYRTDAGGMPETALIKAIDLSREQPVFAVTDTFYVAVDAIDKMDNTHARLAIAGYRVEIDGKPVYDFVNGDIPFSRSHHVNALIQYSQKLLRGHSLYKTYFEPGCALAGLADSPCGGLFTLPPDSLPHMLSIIVFDEAGHRVAKDFSIVRALPSGEGDVSSRTLSFADSAACLREQYAQPLFWNRYNSFAAKDIRMIFEPGSLYDNVMLTVTREDSLLWNFEPCVRPLQRSAAMAWYCPGLPPSLQEKMALAKVGPRNELTFAGGFMRRDSLICRLSAFGRYTVAADTLPPTIKPSFAENADLSRRRGMYFIIDDAFSGIARYDVYIDDAWYLAALDAKSGKLRCEFDARRMKRGQTHRVKVRVVDNKNNVTELNTAFLW